MLHEIVDIRGYFLFHLFQFLMNRLDRQPVFGENPQHTSADQVQQVMDITAAGGHTMQHLHKLYSTSYQSATVSTSVYIEALVKDIESSVYLDDVLLHCEGI